MRRIVIAGAYEQRIRMMRPVSVCYLEYVLDLELALQYPVDILTIPES